MVAAAPTFGQSYNCGWPAGTNATVEPAVSSPGQPFFEPGGRTGLPGWSHGLHPDDHALASAWISWGMKLAGLEAESHITAGLFASDAAGLNWRGQVGIRRGQAVVG